jgi:hypothetical protein
MSILLLQLSVFWVVLAPPTSQAEIPISTIKFHTMAPTKHGQRAQCGKVWPETYLAHQAYCCFVLRHCHQVFNARSQLMFTHVCVVCEQFGLRWMKMHQHLV